MDELKVNLFLSYSHQDEKLCKELQKHLIQLERAGLINQWYDGKILPGSYWDNDIKANLQQADIILFLLSADFLHSEYIYENEVKQALQQHHNGQSVVIPVMLRKCDIELTPFSSIRGLPDYMEPVCSKKWASRDEAFFNVQHGIKSVIYREREKKKIRSKEELAWENAKNTGTITAYADYIKNSALKIHLEEALQQIGVDSAFDYKLKYELQNIELELEKEKSEWVARELHDSIGQQLSVVHLSLSVLESKENKEMVEHVHRITLNIIKELSNLNRPWRDKWYDFHRIEKPTNFNLEESITNLTSLISSAGNIEVNTVFGNLALLDDIYYKTTILRIVQESMHNILKHAHATKVNVSVMNEEDSVTLSISDNGVGITRDGKTKNLGMGLANMKARVEWVEGTFNIIEAENGGCEVRVTIPKR